MVKRIFKKKKLEQLQSLETHLTTIFLKKFQTLNSNFKIVPEGDDQSALFLSYNHCYVVFRLPDSFSL